MGAPSHTNPSIFVSYSHKDSDFTQRLVNDLHSAGADVWVDVEGISHGNFMQRIDDALERCQWMVLVLTPNAIASQNVKNEVYAALNRVSQGYMRDVIPMLAAACEPKIVPPQWATLHHYDATKDYSAALRGLLIAIGLVTTESELGGSGEESAATSGEEQRFWELVMYAHNIADFFEERLCEAFPGVRGLASYSGGEALARLQRLLHPPLVIPQDEGTLDPLWWWRGHSGMRIDQFQVLDEATCRCLMGSHEMLVDKISVFRHPRAYRSFVYAESQADEPSGLYPRTKPDIESQVRELGYAVEGLGYWNGRYIRWEELQDGYAEIDGRAVRTTGAHARVRYLSPYNFFIAGKVSVLNSRTADRVMPAVCHELLERSCTLRDAIAQIDGLPFEGRLAEAYFEIE